MVKEKGKYFECEKDYKIVQSMNTKKKKMEAEVKANMIKKIK